MAPTQCTQAETTVEHTGSENGWTVDQTYYDLPDFVERFWQKVERRGDAECWPWCGAKVASGRGQVHISWSGGKNVRRYAPVVCWELTNHRAVPAGCVVSHSCDNPNCVNPSHLRAVPQAENIRDSVRKGRYNAYGIQKLNATQVREIRTRLAAGEAQRTIAASFNIARNTVSGIATGANWAHLDALNVPSESFQSSRQVDQPRQPVHIPQCAGVHTAGIRGISRQLDSQR